MKKMGFVAAAILLVVMLGSCDLLFGSDAKVRAWNAHHWLAMVQYRVSGTSAWTTAISLLDSGLSEAEVFTIPKGTYDFHVYDWVTTGTYFSAYLYNEEVDSGEDSDYDYTLYLDSDGTLDFY